MFQNNKAMYLVQPTYLKIACDHPTYIYLITIGSSRVTSLEQLSVAEFSGA